MAGNDRVLTRTQKRVIAALLVEKTIAQAAQTAQVGEKTVYRYLANPTFRASLAQAENTTIDEAGRRLLSGQEQALNTLEEVIREGKDSDRRLAAQAWLDLSLRWREMKTFDQRLGELEKAVFGGQ